MNPPGQLITEALHTTTLLIYIYRREMNPLVYLFICQLTVVVVLLIAYCCCCCCCCVLHSNKKHKYNNNKRYIYKGLL